METTVLVTLFGVLAFQSHWEIKVETTKEILGICQNQFQSHWEIKVETTGFTYTVDNKHL